MTTDLGESFGARLRRLRMARGHSQGELARLIGRHQTTIGPYERDEYAPPRAIVERLAELLGATAEYLYTGRSAASRTVRLAGAAGAFGSDLNTLGPMEMILDVGSWLAFRVLDDGMGPVYREGDYVLVGDASPVDPASEMGRDVLAELADGRLLLRRLLPGATPGRYTLGANSAPALPDVAVTGVRPVLGTLASRALRRARVETPSS